MCIAHCAQARLEDGESCVRLSALEAVSLLEPAVRAQQLGHVSRLLADQDWRVRRGAMQMFEEARA